MRATPLPGVLGVEISDIDLREPMSEECVDRIEQLWRDHGILVFRGQELTAAEQEAFVARFGDQFPFPVPDQDGETRNYHYVANCEVEGAQGALSTGIVDLHYDACFRERPYRATVLYALETPRSRGETVFACGRRAYDALSDGMKRRVAGLRAMNAYWNNVATRAENLFYDDSMKQVFPVVVRHPVHGDPVLYVNRLMTQFVIDMAVEESDALLARLFDHIERPEFGYAHQWRVGDLVMWDNFGIVHGRRAFDPAERRVLRRLVVQGGPLQPALAV